MNRDQVEYLKSLVRMDLRKKENSLDKAQRKEGQHPADFRRFQQRQAERIEFVKQVFADLTTEGQ